LEAVGVEHHIHLAMEAHLLEPADLIVFLQQLHQLVAVVDHPIGMALAMMV
jgi:uncharacterized protein YciU (UPF0263 family)